jgi:hypothetical protein
MEMVKVARGKKTFEELGSFSVPYVLSHGLPLKMNQMRWSEGRDLGSHTLCEKEARREEARNRVKAHREIALVCWLCAVGLAGH